MKVLLLGSSGQLGTSIILKKPKGINLISLKKNELDITNKKECKRIIALHKPDWIINSAAYTDVDQAEKNEELALKINRDGPKIICDVLNEIGGNIIHISTDFVFDGKSNKPYLPNHPTNPISVYGFSKAQGEEEIAKVFSNSNRAIILRTSWVMGPFKNNFANTMLRLHSEKETLKVVSDQIGCVTSSISLANICWKIISKKQKEADFNFPLIMHWRDSGITNWYEISKEIGRIGVLLNKFNKKAKIHPIPSNCYPTLAKRPSYSVLDISETKEILNIEPLDWKVSIWNAYQNI